MKDVKKTNIEAAQKTIFIINSRLDALQNMYVCVCVCVCVCEEELQPIAIQLTRLFITPIVVVSTK